MRTPSSKQEEIHTTIPMASLERIRQMLWKASGLRISGFFEQQNYNYIGQMYK